MSNLDFLDGGKNPYEVLELKNGPEATEQEIRKVGLPAWCGCM